MHERKGKVYQESNLFDREWTAESENGQNEL